MKLLIESYIKEQFEVPTKKSKDRRETIQGTQNSQIEKLNDIEKSLYGILTKVNTARESVAMYYQENPDSEDNLYDTDAIMNNVNEINKLLEKN